MDSDLFPLINPDELFSMDINQQSTTDPPFNYSFAAAPNLVSRDVQGEELVGAGFNAGFFILDPDVLLFDRIWELAMIDGQPWNSNRDMEQGLLNEFFASRGKSPMYRLHWSWNLKDMNDEYLPEAKIVHAR